MYNKYSRLTEIHRQQLLRVFTYAQVIILFLYARFAS
jgi:hypothetical protein